jgi:hypothetical protein
MLVMRGPIPDHEWLQAIVPAFMEHFGNLFWQWA